MAEMNSGGGNRSSLPGQACIREPNLPWVSSESSQNPKWQPLLMHALGWESTRFSPSELDGLRALPGWHCDVGFSVLPKGNYASLGFFAGSDPGLTPAAGMVVSSPASGPD